MLRPSYIYSWLVVLLMCWFAAPTQPACASDLFPGRIYPVGFEPYAIATADLDGDGHLDLVTANRAEFCFSIVFGRGDGTFGSEVKVSTSVDQYTDVVISDFDRDGNQDVALSTIDGMSVFGGVGDGTFTEERFYGALSDSLARAAAAADFNNDGRTDIFLGSSSSFPSSIMLSQDDGGFELVTQSRNGASEFAVVGYFDDDEWIDLVGGTPSSGSVRLFRGLGAGALAPGIRLPVSGTSRDAVTDDFNGDGMADLALVKAGSVSILLNTGKGEFANEVSYHAHEQGRRLALLDLDLDGHNDLVVSAWDINSQRNVAILISNGDGSFQPMQLSETPLIGGDLAVGDFDGDGRPSIAALSFWGSTGNQLTAKSGSGAGFRGIAFTLTPDGLGGLVQEGASRFPVGDSPSAIVMEDFDGDGRQDIATANWGSDDVSILLGTPKGEFATHQTYAVGDSPSSIVGGLLNADAALDLAVANENSLDISILLGRGDGSFDFGATVPIAAAPVSMVIGDLTGDGVADLATSSRESNSVTVLLGRGDGRFEVLADLDVGEGPYVLVATDLDGKDGLDLATANLRSDDLSTLLNNGDGTFVPEVRWPAGTYVGSALVAGDVDLDGNQDLVASSSFGIGADLAVLYGDGQGGLSQPEQITLTAGATELQLSDIDGNGWPDLVAAHGLPMATIVLGSDQGFEPPRDYAASRRGRLAIGDIDLDGRLDLAVSSGSFDRVTIVRNQHPIFVRFAGDKQTLRWPLLTGIDGYNVYRGDLSTLIDDDHDGAADPGYGACQNHLDPDTTDSVFVATETPQRGQGFFYLMERIREGVASDLGLTSSGQLRSPFSSCPSQSP